MTTSAPCPGARALLNVGAIAFFAAAAMFYVYHHVRFIEIAFGLITLGGQ